MSKWTPMRSNEDSSRSMKFAGQVQMLYVVCQLNKIILNFQIAWKVAILSNKLFLAPLCVVRWNSHVVGNWILFYYFYSGLRLNVSVTGRGPIRSLLFQLRFLILQSTIWCEFSLFKHGAIIKHSSSLSKICISSEQRRILTGWANLSSVSSGDFIKQFFLQVQVHIHQQIWRTREIFTEEHTY